MDQRTKRTRILLGLIGLMGCYGLVNSFIYPTWIKPALTIDERIAEKKKERNKLKVVEAKVAIAKTQYAEWVARVGAFDIGVVENDVRKLLNALIGEHNLQGATVSSSRATRDGRTGLQHIRLNLTATATMAAAVNFLEGVSELPQLMRVGNVSINPSRTRRQGGDVVNLKVPLDVMVVPPQQIIGVLDPLELERPEKVVRHLPRDYAPLWNGKPFSEFVNLPPLVARAGSDVSATVGQRSVSLPGSGTGGDKRYRYRWEPADKLRSATSARATLKDTSQAERLTFTLTVTDGSGHTATDTVVVAITEPVVTDTVTTTVPTENPTHRVTRWTNRRGMQLAMSLLRQVGTHRVAEVMVYDMQKKENVYYSEGDDFDGGKLALVHPRGSIVLRDDAYFIYPIGEKLDRDVAVDAADDFPQLQAAANRLRDAAAAISEEAESPAPATTPIPTLTPNPSTPNEASGEITDTDAESTLAKTVTSSVAETDLAAVRSTPVALPPVAISPVVEPSATEKGVPGSKSENELPSREAVPIAHDPILPPASADNPVLTGKPDAVQPEVKHTSSEPVEPAFEKGDDLNSLLKTIAEGKGRAAVEGDAQSPPPRIMTRLIRERERRQGERAKQSNRGASPKWPPLQRISREEMLKQQALAAMDAKSTKKKAVKEAQKKPLAKAPRETKKSMIAKRVKAAKDREKRLLAARKRVAEAKKKRAAAVKKKSAKGSASKPQAKKSDASKDDKKGTQSGGKKTDPTKKKKDSKSK